MTVAKPDSLTQEMLHLWLEYNPDTGIFTWKQKPGRGTPVGKVAGSVQMDHGKKRRILWVQGKRIYGARAAYIYVHGDIPATALVDHRDGDTFNDRISNLRMASAVQNVWNRVRGEGLPGVSKDVRGRFKSRIQLQCGTKLNLGTWDTEAEAAAAYLGAAAVLHGAFSVQNRKA